VKNLIKIGAILVFLFGLVWSLSPNPPHQSTQKFDLQREILPYFKGYDSTSGTSVNIEGSPEIITSFKGRVVVGFTTEDGRTIYVNPLAIRSKTWGEHPAKKLLRLKEEYGLSIGRVLESILKNSLLRNFIFRSVTFEYRPGMILSGVVAEINIDGSFLVIPSYIPPDWKAVKSGNLEPSFFSVIFNPEDTNHQMIHSRTLYQVDYDLMGVTLFEKMYTLLTNHKGANRNSNRWLVEQLRQLGLNLESDINSISRYRVSGGDAYFTVSNGFTDSTKGIFYKLTPDDELVEIFRTPGRFLMLGFDPLNPTRLLVSAEGYDRSDTRYQSIFEVDLETSNWQVVEFPIPTDFELYGGQTYFFAQDGILMVKRYGFIWEGGGVWIIDPSDPNYGPKKMLLAWDHFLNWIVFPTEDSRVFIFAFTAKEVEDHFAMTINQAEILLDGENTTITQTQRIALLRGWNPQPIYIQSIGEGRYLMYVDSKFDYNSYLEGRPSAIYVVEISR